MGNSESQSDTAFTGDLSELMKPVRQALVGVSHGIASTNAVSAADCVATKMLAKPAVAVPHLVSVIDATVQVRTPFLFPDQITFEILNALKKLMMDRMREQAEDDEYSGYFILALLFAEHEMYTTAVLAAFREEACDKSSALQSIFVPGGDIGDPKWAETKVKMYVFSQYGNYIDQKHSRVHKGLIVVYEDQSKQSSNLFTFHRFDLAATTKEDYRNLKEKIEKRQGMVNSDPSASFAKSAIPLNELVEEFYYRSLMKAGQPSLVPQELVKILMFSRPDVFVQRLMNIVEGSGKSPAELAEAIIAKDFSAFVSSGVSREAFRAWFSTSGSSSSGSSPSSHNGQNNMLTQELNLRENLDFPEMQCVPSFEGIIEDVTLAQLWSVLQTTMGDYPPMYNLFWANCIEFCNAVINNLKSVLDMDPDMGSDRATVYKICPALLELWLASI